MRKISTFSRCFLNYSFVVITALSLFYSSETKAQCAGVTVTPPTLDVRGSTDLCSGGRLEICPLVWGYSNYQWYKDGVAYSTASCIDITNLGSYTLAGQDGGGCWSAPSTAVVVTGGIAPATPTVTASNSTTFCSGGSVLLTSSATTGNQWYKDGIAIGGATDSTYTATVSGVYTVSVMGCSTSTSLGITITVTAAPIVTAIIGGTNACVGSTLTLVDTTTGGTWASSNTSIATVSGGVVTAIAAGTDTITYTKTSGSCTTTVSQIITVSSSTTPTLDVRGSTTLCGDSVQVCPLVWGYSNYQWYKDGVAFSTASCIYISTAGSYTLTGTNGNGCWSSASTAVLVTAGTAPATPTVSVSGATTFCSGGSVVLRSSSSTANQWYKDSIAIGGATDSTYTATTSGVYTVATIGCGKSTSTGTTVTATAAAIVTAIIGGTNACVGSTLTLVDTTTGGTWTSSNTSIATVSAGIVTAIAAGTDTITYTKTSGSCTTTVSQIITVSAVTTPTLDVRGSTTLCGDSVQVCPLVWGYSNYQWYKNGVAFSTSSCIYITAAGSYTLTGTNGNGCWSSPSTAVVVTAGTPLATPTVSAGGLTTFCGGGSVVLRSSSSTANQWYKDSIAIYGATDSTYTATTSGVYTVATIGCGKSTSIGTTVAATAAPIVTAIIGSTNACVGSTLTLVDTTIGGIWASSNTSIAAVSVGIVTAIAAGTDTITYTKTNGGCTTTVSKIITVSASTTPTLDVRGSTVLCGSTVLQICPAIFGYSNYQWYKNGVAIAAPTGTGACINIDTAALGSYTLTGTNSSGCWSSASTAVVVTAGTPPATPTVSAGSTSICSGSSVMLTSSATTGNQWNKDGVAISGATSQTYTATASGVYTVSAIGCGKSTSAGTTVTVAVAPTIASIVGGTNACVGSTLTLTNATTGGTWASSNTSVATVIAGVVTAIAAGTDTITYTKTNGSCTTTVSKVISISSVTTPTLDIRGSVNICGSGSLQMCPLVWGYSNYQWYKDGVAYSTSSCITVNTAGSYTLTGTNGSGCWSSPSIPAVVTLNPIPTMVATTGPTAVCAGSSITLVNSSTIPSGGTGVWSSGALTNVIVGASTGVITGTNATSSVVVKYTVTSAVGCTNYTNYNVTINAIPSVPSITYAPGTVNPQAGAPTGSFCANRTFTVVGIPSGGVWSKTGPITVTTPAGVVTTGSAAGSGSIKYTYTDANGCVNSRTMVGNVYVCAARGIANTSEPLAISNDFTMYPNPARSQVSINVETLVGTGNIIVTDLYGKVVKSQTLSMGTNTLNISKLSAGMYLVSIITNEGKQTKKLIIE